MWKCFPIGRNERVFPWQKIQKSLAELHGWSCADADQGGFYKSKSEFPISIHLTRLAHRPSKRESIATFLDPLRSNYISLYFYSPSYRRRTMNEYIQLLIPEFYTKITVPSMPRSIGSLKSRHYFAVTDYMSRPVPPNPANLGSDRHT